jgi:hypothetical protein
MRHFILGKFILFPFVFNAIMLAVDKSVDEIKSFFFIIKDNGFEDGFT